MANIKDFQPPPSHIISDDEYTRLLAIEKLAGELTTKPHEKHPLCYYDDWGNDFYCIACEKVAILDRVGKRYSCTSPTCPAVQLRDKLEVSCDE